MKFTRPAALAVIFCGSLVMPPQAARAEVNMGHKYNKPDVGATPLPFTKDDFVNVAREKMERDTFILGEPIMVPLRLINHTAFTINAMTSLNAQAGLEIQIRKVKPSAESPRACKGPHPPGSYTPGPVVLYPFEEFPLRATIWADREAENGLAFPTPGEYVVQVGLKVSPELSNVSGVIPTDPFLVKIIEPTGPDAEIVKSLAAKKGFIQIQMRKIPEGMEEDLKRWVASAPGGVLTPYLAHTLGQLEFARALKEIEGRAHADLAIEYFKVAAKEDSPTRPDALDDMFRLYDKLGESFLAKQTAQEVLRAMPPEVATRKGSTVEVKKYLYNTTELDPITYWDLLR